MDTKTLKIQKKDINNILDRLSQSYRIFLPKIVEKKGYRFYDWDLYNKSQELEFKTGVPKSSVKQFFFPQPETLFDFSMEKGDITVKVPQKDATNVIFGVRPCDARSIILNALPYVEDTYYMDRLKGNIIVGHLCHESCKTCFCLWSGGSPVGNDGMDISIIEMDDYYFFEFITQRGKDLMEPLIGDLIPANSEEIEKIKRFKDSQTSRKNSFPDPVKKITDKNLLDLYNRDFFQDVSFSCINCGICTFLCPTCFCFDIQDETLENKGKRIRYWDSCMFPLFTHHATGHNPRGEKYQRVRNRFMHKLKYFPDRYGVFSCVGCGRCIKECPVNIDIREVLRDLLI